MCPSLLFSDTGGLCCAKSVFHTERRKAELNALSPPSAPNLCFSAPFMTSGPFLPLPLELTAQGSLLHSYLVNFQSSLLSSTLGHRTHF